MNNRSRVTNNSIDSHSSSLELEEILSQFVDENGICKMCGHDHSFTPTFEGVKTSIDIISELFGKVKNLEVKK
jgi:hypothetical protein